MPDCDSIERVCDSLVNRGMISVAIFLLEMHKPLVGIVAISLEAFRPVLIGLLGDSTARHLTEVLRDRESVEKLILALEGRRTRAV